MGPIDRVNVDFTSPLLDELDRAAEALNVSRQAVIKTLLRQALVSTTSLQPPHRERSGSGLQRVLSGFESGSFAAAYCCSHQFATEL